MTLWTEALDAGPLWMRTGLLALASTLGALVLALPAGWALARRRGGLLLGLVLALAVLPTSLSAIGWIAAFGTQGLLPLPWLYSPAGVALAWTLCFWPLLALGVWGALSCGEAAEEEAALLALPSWRVALGVVLPKALPALAAAAVGVAILMLGDLGVPGSLSVPVGAEAVHARFSSTFRASAALGASLPMMALAFLLAWLCRGGWRGLASPASDRGAKGLEGISRTAYAVAWVLALGSLLIPAWGLAGWALQGGGFTKALALLGREGVTTLLLAVATGLGAAGLGFAVCVLLPRLSGAAALGAVLLFAAPGTLVGAGLIRLFNAEGWRGALYASPAVLLIALLARSLAPALLLARRSLASLPASYDEAARLCGIPRWRRAMSLAGPLCAGSLVAGALAAAVIAAGELGASALVSPPGVQTLAVRLFSLIHYGADAAVAATALMGMTFVLLLGFGISRKIRA